MSNVEYMGMADGSTIDVTPEQALEIALDKVKNKKEGVIGSATKLVVFALDDSDGSYDVGSVSSNMTCAEALALLEVTKAHMLNQMGYSVFPEDIEEY